MSDSGIFKAAVKLPTDQRAAYVDEACGDNLALRQEVESLLQAHDAPGSFLGPLCAGRGMTEGFQPMTERPGTQIGPYKLLEQIGEGGMGVVFMAEQTQPIQRRVALKIIKAGMDTRQVVARFEAERQALAMMDHPNIARVLETGATDTDRPYFVMELVRGVPMTEFCNEKNLSIRERLELFVTVCQAVQHAHQKGIIHRDIKPTNVLVTLHDGRPVIKVIDFGVAKATGQKLTDKTLFTGFAQMIGTPLYMSPEQAEMTSQDIDTRSDIFSAGVLLYELLTGTTPFDSERLKSASFDELRRIIREEEPPRPSTRLTTIAAEAASTVGSQRKSDPRQLTRLFRGELDWIVMKCLEKDRTRRYETANALADDVERYLHDEPVQACPPSARYRFGKFARRNKVTLVTAVVVMTALVLGTIVSTWQAIRASNAEAQANHSEQGAQESLKFLVSAFRSPDPERGGRTITVAEVLDRSVRELQDKFADDPVTKAKLMFAIGQSYSSLGLFREAIPPFEQARDMFIATEGRENDDTLHAMHELASAYLKDGRVAAAIRLAEEVLKTYRAKLGPEHPETLSAINSLSNTYMCAGRTEEATQLDQENLKNCEAKLRPEDPIRIQSMVCLALDYRSTGRIDEAIRLIEQVLKVRNSKLGADHRDTLWTTHTLAKLYLSAGRLNEALPLFEETLRLRKAKLGPDHPQALESMVCLAIAYNDAGRLDESLLIAEEVLKLVGAKPGSGSLETLYSMSDLAIAYEAAGRIDEAIRLFEETLKLQKAKLGPDHRDVLGAMSNLSGAYRVAGRTNDCIRLAEETLQLRKTKLGPDHLDTLDSMSNLAIAYEAAGRIDEAIRLDEESLKLRTAKLGRDHPDTLGSMKNLALDYRAAGRTNDCVRLFEEALQLRKTKLGPDHPDTLNLMKRLSGVYLEAGRSDEAVRLGEESLKLQKAKLGPEHADTLGTMVDLVDDYMSADRPSEAEPLARECVRIRETKSPDDWQTFSARWLLGDVLLAQKKYAEAEPLLVSGYEGLHERAAKIPSGDKDCLSGALESLVQLYEATNQPEKAATWKTKLAELDKAAANATPVAPKGDSPQAKKADSPIEPNPPSRMTNKSDG